MIHVLYVTSSEELETFLAPEVRELTRRGIRPHVVSLRDAGRWPTLLQVARGLPKISRDLDPLAREEASKLGLNAFAKNCLALAFAAGLSQRDLRDVDHVHAYWASAPATAALVLARLLDVPFSFTGHRWDIYAAQLLRWKIQRASFVRAISERGRSLICDASPDSQTPVTVIRVGVELPATVPRADHPKNPRFLTVGNLERVKGHELLFEAIEVLAARGIDVEVDLVGDGPERRHLESLVRRSAALSSRVVMLGRLRHQEVLERMTSNYTAIVHSSISAPAGLEEGVPVVLLEAAARGLPIIATSSGATTELVTEETGWTCQCNSSSALYDAMMDALESEVERVRRASNARTRVHEQWDVRTTGRQMSDLFSTHAS